MTPVLRVSNLSFTYSDGQPALSDVSFSLDEGETLAVIGPNGAGKSTLMSHLVGLLPAAGNVEALGMPLKAGNLKEIRRCVGLVFQDPDDQLFCPTVFDDVAFGPLNLGMPADEVRRAVARSLGMVGMANCEGRASHHLSLGEKKRVALACVLAVSPRILILDEPTANLDPGGRWDFILLLRGLANSKIIVTHDLELAGELATRVMVMDRGRVVAAGPAQEILSDKKLLASHRLTHT
jgi:cobalt/nickel transport system ATP-binding protein